MAGKFIVFEGLDGSGQSTQARLLAEKLRAEGRAVILGKEPTGDSKAGLEIAEVLAHRKSVTPKRLQELFVEDRQEHIHKIIMPALNNGAIFIEDRYVMSTYAFGMLDCDFSWLQSLNENFPQPDLTFVLKVRPETSLMRIAARGKPSELFEEKGKLEKISKIYENLASQMKGCYVIDCELPIAKVHAQVLQHLAGVLK